MSMGVDKEMQPGHTPVDFIHMVTDANIVPNEIIDEYTDVVKEVGDQISSGLGDPIKRTGRGAFYEVTVLDDMPIIIYRKGIGDKKLDGHFPKKARLGEDLEVEKQKLYQEIGNLRTRLTERDHSVLGQLRDLESRVRDAKYDEPLYYDNPKSRSDPRLRGALSLGWATMEALNGTLVFDVLYKENRDRWTSLKDILVDGVSIPIGLVEDIELSKDMNRLRGERLVAEAESAQKEDPGPNGEARISPGFADDIHDHLGIITEVVPGNKRQQDLSEEGRLYDDPEMPTRTARTLRQLRKLGVIFSPASSHEQNLYTDGFLSYADMGDFLFLGDYGDDDELRELLYLHMNRTSRMFPTTFPTPSFRYKEGPDNYRVGLDEVREYFYSFWDEYLSDVLSGDEDQIKIKKIENVYKCMTVLKDETNLALAQLLLDDYNDKNVDGSIDLAKRREELYRKNDSEELPLIQMFDHRRDEAVIKDHTHRQVLGLDEMAEDIKDSEGKPWYAIYNYLKTGDESELRDLDKNPEISRILRMWDKIEMAEESDLRSGRVFEMLEQINRIDFEHPIRKAGFNNPSISYQSKSVEDRMRIMDLYISSLHLG